MAEKQQTKCCTNETPPTGEVKTETANMNSHHYIVKGMDCPACANTIKKSLEKLAGINSVDVNYSTGKMNVTVDGEVPAIESQLSKLGYSAEPVIAKGEKEIYLIEGMDCSSCAATIEKHLKTVPFVKEASVNFSTGKLQVTHDKTPEDIIKEVDKAGFRATKASKGRKTETQERKQSGLPLAVFAGLLLVLGFVGSLTDTIDPLVANILYAVTIVLGGYKPAKSAFYAIRSKSLDMNVLMVAAAIGAAFIGEWFEGATVVWLFAVGNLLQTRSIEKTRDSIRNLMNLAPSEAWVKTMSGLEKREVEEVSVDDIIIIKPGEKIPLDGEVIKGNTSVNQAPITGESIPVDKFEGDVVFAGTVNESGSIEVKVTKLVEDTTIAKIIHLVEEAQEQKAPTQAFVDKFATIYTPIVFILAILTMLVPPLIGFGTFAIWFYRGLELLVVACPCALVISTPVAIVSAIGNAAKNGVLIKGGTFLERAGTINAIAFDKTGTLTEGKPKVTNIISTGDEQQLLSIAYTIEEHSKHPIAMAITNYAKDKSIPLLPGENFKAIVGKGAQATINNETYFVGNMKLFKEYRIDLGELEKKATDMQSEGQTVVIVGTETNVLGMITVADAVRDISIKAVSKLKQVGITDVVMLTGDNQGTARKISGETGVSRYFAELLPENKVDVVKQLQAEGKTVAMVGDGINDAPALATADIGVAMGGAGTDTAMETADIVLMADNLEKLPHTIKLSRKALTIIKQNIWFSIITKLIALALIFPGYLTLWLAVLSDTGAALVVILNSMRLLRFKDK